MKKQGKIYNMPETELQVKPVQEPVQKMSRLINSIYYFIEFVFIIVENEGYRLVSMHQGKLLTNQIYKTAKGARIAFLKFWNYRAWKEGVKPKWSVFYPPDAKWLKKIMEQIAKTQC
jgi:hypothetical protein